MSWIPAARSIVRLVGRRLPSGRVVRRPVRGWTFPGLGSSGKIPKKIYMPGRTKLMPRMFRRGYGVGGLVRRRRKYPVRRRVYRKKTQNKVHNFIRWCDKDSLYPDSLGPSQITAAAADQNLVYSFKLDNLVKPDDFTNLFDVYKINKITMYMERVRDQTGAGGGAPINKKIAVVWDDDANALSGEDAYLEYANCRRYNIVGSSAIKLTLYPKISNAVLNVGGTTAYTTLPSSRQWLKIEDDEVPHFGFKVFVPGGTEIAGQLLFNVRVKYHLSLKNSK